MIMHLDIDISKQIKNLSLFSISVVHGLFYFYYLLPLEYYQNPWISSIKEKFNSLIILQIGFIVIYFLFGWLIGAYDFVKGRPQKLILYLPNLVILSFSIVFNFYLRAWVIESESGLDTVDRAMKVFLFFYIIVTMP